MSVVNQKIEKWLKLQDLAREQGGFFTASQAEDVGFDNANMHRLVSDGRWRRERRGVFHLTGEPEGELSDIHLVGLIFRGRDGVPTGIVGLESAAAVHGLGDFMPGKITVLVDHTFRKRAEIPGIVNVIRVDDISRNVVSMGGFVATSPVRTIAELAVKSDIDTEETRRAFVSARKSGLITFNELSDFVSTSPSLAAATLSKWEKAVSGKDLAL